VTPPPPVPHLTYDHLRRHAEAFLTKYHPTQQIPVPIEHIIEFQLHLDIVPLPGLEEAFEIVGYTASTLDEISVDQYVYEHQPGRYRFTLAHEVGHVVLHADLFKEHRFRSVVEWKRFVRAFPDLDLSRLEWQAHSFAGLVLVPSEALQREFKSAAKQVKARSVAKETDFAKSLIVDMVATRFQVSGDVIERRLSYDQIKLADLWT
jgi:hypothetical protein